MKRRAFGRTGLEVAPIALGGFPFGGVHRAAGWDPFSPEGRRTALATIDRALERGISDDVAGPAKHGVTPKRVDRYVSLS